MFNQAAALVIQTFDMQRLQFHDYHGVLSLMYLPAGMKPEVLYVAHNADYNGSWLLTSDRRARYLYAMFNLHMSADTRRCCEHQGRFDMLRIVVSYMLREQAGLGVVAVSPLYAPRVHQKFSQFWTLPKARLRGILNGPMGMGVVLHVSHVYVCCTVGGKYKQRGRRCVATVPPCRHRRGRAPHPAARRHPGAV